MTHATKQTDRTLLEQLRFNEFEIELRKKLFGFDEEDEVNLKNNRLFIESKLDSIVNQFYENQTNNPDIALLIGDSDTLARLAHAQRHYILDLFSGHYGVEYINNRLRIGLVHKRIGVEPKLYLSAIHTLKQLLTLTIHQNTESKEQQDKVLTSLEKLIMFDNTLVFDTYIRSLVSEIEIAKQKSDLYAKDLEQKVLDRTRQLEELSQTDALTGLLNVRHLQTTIHNVLRAAERRKEPVSMVYIDIDDFKELNDTKGHQAGDELLKEVATIIKNCSRAEDCAFRYGGDEFCIILPNCTKEDAKQRFCSRIREEIARYSAYIQVSQGLVQTGPIEYHSPIKLLDDADKAMYECKKKHKEQKLNEQAKLQGKPKSA